MHTHRGAELVACEGSLLLGVEQPKNLNVLVERVLTLVLDASLGHVGNQLVTAGRWSDRRWVGANKADL